MMLRRAVGGYAPKDFLCEETMKKDPGTCLRGALNMSSPQYQQLDKDTEGGTYKVLDWKFDPLHSYHKAAMEAVSCTLCHQVEDDGNLGTLEGFSGHFTTDALYGMGAQRLRSRRQQRAQLPILSYASCR